MLAYGLLLRLDINRQLVRKAFKADNASVYMNYTLDQVRECLRCDNRTSQVPNPSNSTFMSTGEPDDNSTATTSENELQDVNICHPTPELSGDASRSRIAFLCMGIFSASLDQGLHRLSQNFSATRILTLVTLGIVIALITNAFIVDGNNIPLSSTFFKPGTGSN